MSSKPSTRTPSSSRERVGDRVTIYRRGRSGVYTADYWMNGCHHRKSLSTTNKRIARQRAAKLEHQIMNGKLKRKFSDVAVVDAVDRYLEFLEVENKAHKTLVRYRGELSRFAGFLEGRGIVKLSQITITAFDEFRRCRSRKIKPKTAYHEAVVAKQVLNWCVSRGMLPANPLADLKLKKPPRIRKPVLAQCDVRNILSHCSPAVHDQVMVLAMTGIRVGELQALEKTSVDLSRGIITIDRQITGPTKTKDTRRIPIHHRLRPVVQAILRANRHALLVTAAPSSKYPGGGHHINPKRLNEQFKAAAAKTGLNGFTLHSLRHSFNTHCINCGVPERAVKAWMGHRDRSMTEQYYELSDEESRRFIDQGDFGLLD